jgi:hypothetical protein
MNKKKTLIIIGGLVATGTAIYFIFRKKPASKVGAFIRKTEDKLSSITGTSTASLPSSSTTKITSVNIGGQKITAPTGGTLGRGSKGEDVKNLQTLLNAVYGANLQVDGIFGPLTEAALVDATGKTELTKADAEKLIQAAAASMGLG